MIKIVSVCHLGSLIVMISASVVAVQNSLKIGLTRFILLSRITITPLCLLLGFELF